MLFSTVGQWILAGNMKIAHIALWASDLEGLRDFYVNYFGATAGPRYTNPRTGFTSYFLHFGAGTRLELMHRPNLPPAQAGVEHIGLAHFALSAGSAAGVDQLTRQLQAAGFAVLSGPRWTGDGYYESVILDPEGNRVEITI